MRKEGDLRPLVAKIVAGYGWKLPLESGGFIPPPQMFEDIESAEREILKLLPRHPFRARGHLSEWVLREAATAVSAGSDPRDPNMTAEITARLLNDPNAPFEFSCGFNNESDQSYRVALTEDLVLEVKTELHDDGSFSDLGAELRGKVFGYSYGVAIEESCRVIREVIGALLAVGLASNGSFFMRGDEPDFELTGGPAFEAEADATPTPGELIDLVSRIHLDEYEGSQLDQARAARTAAYVADRVVQQIVRLWNDDSERAREIRTACGLYARGEVATDPGVAVISYSMCLEGLLLDRTVKENVIVRLIEAVAYRLGRSAEDRQRWRKVVRSLYDLRSEYVHTGTIQADFELQESWARTAREALRREIEDY